MKKNNQSWHSEEYGFFGTFYNIGDHSIEGFDNRLKLSRKERTKREVDYVLKYLAPSDNQVLLDCPCGTGRHSLELSKNGFSVLGVDLNESMLTIARSESEQLSDETPTFMKMDMRSLELSDSSVDFVINMFISFGFFESDKDNRKVLEEFYRVLRPGGKVMIHLDLNYDNVISGKFFGTEHVTRNCSYGNEKRTLEIREEYDYKSKRLKGSWTLINGEREVKEYSLRVYDNKKELIPLFNSCGFKDVHIIDPNGGGVNKGTGETIILATK